MPARIGESIFTMKKGTEVADRFDGTTVPVPVPEGGTPEERLALAVQEYGADYTERMFRQAHILATQKYVKDAANEADSTVDSLRARALVNPKTRSTGKTRETGKAPSPATIERRAEKAAMAELAPTASIAEFKQKVAEKKAAMLAESKAKAAANGGTAPTTEAKPAAAKPAKAGK